jgi:uncharacterized membrane protein
MSKLRRYFITGLIVILPLVATIYILAGIFNFSDGLLGRFINDYLEKTIGFYIPGLGLLLFLTIILLVGFLVTNILFKRLFYHLETLFLKFPLIRQIYPAVKQIVDYLFSKEKPAFKKVVIVEYPRKGVWSLGFITNEAMKDVEDKTNQKVLNVFIPSTPNPMTGYFIFVPKNDAVFLDISVEDGLRMVISGGVFNPPHKEQS